MASSTDQPQRPEPGKVAPEAAEAKEAAAAATTNLLKADLVLRLLLFSTTLVALVVMVTIKQTKLVVTPLSPFPLVLDAKFKYSSALIYFVVANSVGCLYSILTLLMSAFSISKPSPSAKLLLLLSSMDALMAGIVASATGAVASIAYIGLKGNSHVRWMKVCDQFDKFCWHVGSSVIISLVASIVLVLLIVVSAHSLYLRSQ